MDGRFRLRGRLGAGGMSVVWRAHDEVLGRDVAVKVLSPGLARDRSLLADIRAEARAIARLRHPNIVEVYDYGEAGTLPYLVMEVAEGRTLAQLLTAGALPWQTAVVIGTQVAAALAAAHDRNVVHRDVKPANVVVSGARVKLLDFGISALSGDDDRRTGHLLGTPAYLAPERLEHGVVRPSTDVYALGLLLYRALAGRLPWEASTATQMLRAHRYQEPAVLPRIAGLPAEVADLCRRCLSKDPARRPAAAEAAVALAAAAGLDPVILALPGTPGTAPVPAPERHTRPAPTEAATMPGGGPRRSRRVAVMGAAVLVAAGAAGAVMLPDDSPGPTTQAQAAAPVPAAPSTAPPRPQCTVGFVVAAADGRFTTKVNVANSGQVPIPASSLTFTLAADHRLAGGTPGRWRQSGRTVAARVAELAPGHDHTAVVRGTYRGSNTPPGHFKLDDTECRITLSVAQTAPLTASAPKPAKAEPAKPAPAEKKVKPPKPKDEDDEDDGEE
ncbi:serine/threonine protein kinase [Actinoplanes italicus]|uniref:non-specific serine/threonine protein kinase n=2 Tax=Actinoplanes italicus TaxID=113567 RepID=A0A2T0KET3_9ACTN|nr:serine/threonine-protein kinase [Actinoplanes italicus]GIE29693.1 serine/threonine protein kinase [Actinoplanes italicus]